MTIGTNSKVTLNNFNKPISPDIGDHHGPPAKLDGSNPLYNNKVAVNIFKEANCSRDTTIYHANSSGPTPGSGGSSSFINYEFSTPWCSKIEDYVLNTIIGRGAYAEVKESTHKKTGEKVAIKQYDRYKLLDV